MELLLSVQHFLHLHQGDQALNSTVYINSISLSKDLVAIITRHFIQIFTLITALLSSILSITSLFHNLCAHHRMTCHSVYIPGRVQEGLTVYLQNGFLPDVQVYQQPN